MLCVPQVDGECYVLPDAFVNAVSSLYTEESLKTLAKQLAPDCITKANADAKLSKRPNIFSSKHLRPQLSRVPTPCYSILPISVYR